MAPSASALRAATGPGLVGEPVERGVMEDDRHVVRGALQIDLDGEAFAHRGLTAEALFSTMPLAASCRPRWAIGRFSQSSSAMEALKPEGLVYRENRIDLDGGAERQARAADGDAGMASLVARALRPSARRRR